MERARELLDSFDCPTTRSEDLLDAAETMGRHKIAYFDALILTVASRAGATVLVSEDMQDGLEIEGLKIINPFASANETLLGDYLGPAF